MLRRFVCILTAIAMIFCLSLSNFAGLTVFADDEEAYSEITSSSNVLTSGTYKLTSDVTLSKYLQIESGVEVTLDLNGHKVSGSDKYVIRIYGTLNLIDSSADGSGSVVNSSTSSGTYGIYIYGGTLNMHGGTVSGVYGIYPYSGECTISITGGTVEGTRNSAIYYKSSSGSLIISGTDRVEIVSKGTSTGMYGIYCVTLSITNPNAYVSANSSNGFVKATSSKSTITAGHYSTTVKNYVPDGYTCSETDDADYPYVVTADVELPALYGETLTLDGSVGVTYYFNMTDQTDPDAYTLVASIDGTDEIQTVSASGSMTVDNAVYYRYTVYVNPTQFSSTISAYLTDGTNSTATYDYSVATYCKKAIERGWDESELCKALLNYGDYATAYYSGISTCSLDGVDGWTDPVAGEWTADLSKYSGTETEGTAKALLLGDSVVIRVYMTSDVASESDVFTVGGTVLEKHALENESYAYYVEFKVSAKNMSKTFTVMKNGEEFTSYSVLSYVNNVISADSSDPALSNLCKAIYYYSVAADDYTGWQ